MTARAWWARSARAALLAGLVAAPALRAADPVVPRVRYDNPVAGLSLELPEDWEMGSGDYGNLMIGLDAEAGPSAVYALPQLSFFYSKLGTEETAKQLAQAFAQLDRVTPQVGPTGRGEDWEVRFTASGTRGALAQRWLVRRERNITYVLGATVRADCAAASQDDIDTAFRTCRLMAGPRVQRFMEPTENAYRLLLPRDWQWSGRIVRTQATPGFFEWRALTADGLRGAFSAEPGVFNIQTPYTPADQAARTIVLPYLAQQIPGLQLESVHPLPRVSAYYEALVKAARLGDRPQITKVRADYRATVNGTPCRMRLTIVCWMLDTSEWLGGRGNWFLYASGAWAPVDQWEHDYPIGRGVIASLSTDPDWKTRQFEAVNDVTLHRAWWRDFWGWLRNIVMFHLPD